MLAVFTGLRPSANLNYGRLMVHRGTIILAGLVFIAMFDCEPVKAAEWETACDKKICQLFREIKNKKGDLLSRLYFHGVDDPASKSEEKKILAIVSLPLGLYIPAGVTVTVDKTLTFSGTLLDCRVEQGCRAAFELFPATLDAMKRGKTISFSILDGQDRRNLTFSFSLIGFSAAYRKFERKLRENDNSG